MVKLNLLSTPSFRHTSHSTQSKSSPTSPTTSPKASSYFPQVTISTAPSSASSSRSSSPRSSYTSAFSTSISANNSLRKSILQQRLLHLQMGPPMRLTQHQLHHHIKLQNPYLNQIRAQHSHKKTQSFQLAGKLEDIMSNSIQQAKLLPLFLSKDCDSPPSTEPSCSLDYVYTAPCEHHPCKGQKDYLINDMFPKLIHDLSTIEFGIRIADFMPLAFKTVPVVGLAEKELQLLHNLGYLPNVIHLQDSFVNDIGDTVLVLPMLKTFECQAANKSLCSIRKTVQQILTGLAAVHAKNIVHLDINPSNLMMTHDRKEIVIIDFGLSMTVDRALGAKANQVPLCGTTGYIAPEIMNPHFYDSDEHGVDPTLADLYSLGIVLGEMLEPYIPDCDLHYFGSKYLGIENTNQSVILLKEFIAQGACYPRVLVQAADLLCILLQEQPRDRQSAQQLLDTHSFLQSPPSTPSSPISPTSPMSTTSTKSNEAEATTLLLCDWLCRVQEIKYQRYLLQEQDGCEIYRYR
ncbi:hypothetical protein BGZ92_001256 [Podila epicladia]|nr:hypothetical protein BGZ92_001256 [Podila epicladia]